MLGLPWLVGTIWMVYLDSMAQPGTRVNWFKSLGYGYFLGLVFLVPLVQIAFYLDIQSTAAFVGTGLGLFSLVGGLLLWRRYAAGYLNLSPYRSEARSHSSILLIMLVFLVLLHLYFSALDAFARPVFPWDAWTTWVYRAKVWYLNHAIVPMQGASAWLSADGELGYSINAYAYPEAVSLVFLWPPLVTGVWSDALATLGGWTAGVAIALALYGQSRAVGGSLLGGAIIAYLFLSLPLVGAHLALPGYADIFMAGFAGLGLVSLLRWGADRSCLSELVLGMLLLAFSIMIKREGVVWFAVGLAYIVLQIFPWRWLLLLGLSLAIAWLLGFQSVDIPLLGQIGIKNGMLHVPLVGAMPVQAHDISSVIASNLFTNGSWSLLFYVLVLVLILSAFYRSAGVVAVAPVYLLILGAIVVIFGFSPEARWAEDNTAINRLLIQVLPALLMGLGLLVLPLVKKVESTEMEREAAR